MNALFYFAGYHFCNNEWWRFAITVPNGPHDRYAQARELLSKEYQQLSRWNGQFVCLTSDSVFKEL